MEYFFVSGVFLAGLMLGAIGVRFWIRRQTAVTKPGNDELTAQLKDRQRSLQVLVDIMVQSAQRQQASLRASVNNLIGDTTDLAQDNTQAMSSMANSLGQSKQILEEVTGQIGQLLEIAGEGEAVSETLKTVIDEFKTTAEQLGHVQKQMTQVLDKASAINSIGQEAEMLALNAAIEAARAGDAGRGFAVVADSMKSLAKSSQVISHEVQAVLQGSSQDIERVSTSVEDKSHRVIESSDTLVSAFERLNGLLSHFIQCIQQLDGAFLEAQVFVGSQSEQARMKAESAIRAITLEANGLLGLEITDLTPRDVASQLDRFDQLIDVRRSEEFNDELGHIPGAKLLTLQSDFQAEVDALDKDKSYLFICRSGGRSTKAAQQALFRGIMHVYNLDGGMIAWRKAGL